MATIAEQALRAERRADTLALAKRVAKLVRDALEGHTSEESYAAATGYGQTRVHAWWSCAAHAPLWILAHAATPLPVVLALVSDLLAVRAGPTGARASCETATALLVRACGEALAEAGRALADGRVSADERAALRPILRELRNRVDAWLRDHGGATDEHPATRGDA